ncbi:hypothetical protein [Bacillus sp. B-jedd]|uniref:hypothetical protein n=1 Tax=Bacillus sp. B-jedd TaxID=1476857 RepID=UPI00051570D9|nr:hypothetical protein [Bacillus sp. B-jedd]CEG27765.1 hypothetical protein BN1002_02637 [Bacillus sp. B-jedd]
MKKLVALFTVLILLTSCSSDNGKKQESKPGDADKAGQQDQEKQPAKETGQKSVGKGDSQPDNSSAPPQASIPTDEYFPDAQQTKTFKGTGNEFAGEVETVFTREGNYLATVVDNGGTRILRVYQLDKKGISLVYEEPEYYSEDAPEIESFKQAFKPQLILPNPVKLNQKFDGWIVKKINETVTVPYGKVDKVIVLEQKEEDGSFAETYWAPRLGIIKKAFYMKGASENEPAVTTELERVEQTD